MGTSPRREVRVAVRINSVIWREEVERLNPRSPARIAADREHRRVLKDGVTATQLLRCANEGSDGTRLAGLLKLYVPITTSAVSERHTASFCPQAGTTTASTSSLLHSGFGTLRGAPAAFTSARTNGFTDAIRTSSEVEPTSAQGRTRAAGADCPGPRERSPQSSNYRRTWFASEQATPASSASGIGTGDAQLSRRQRRSRGQSLVSSDGREPEDNCLCSGEQSARATRS